MSKKFLIKLLKRTAITLVVVLILLVGSGITVVYVYEDELKQLAVKELNKYLDAPVKIAKIELTVWDKFPDASLRFSEVFIPDLLDDTGQDTLIFAKSVYLNINIWDLLNGNYIVKDIQAEDAVAHLKIDPEGRDNYTFWKSDTAAIEQQFKFELKQVALTRALVTLDIAPSEVFQKYTVNKAALSGEFNHRAIHLEADASLILHELQVGKMMVFYEKDVSVKSPLYIDKDSSFVAFEKGIIGIAGLRFETTGKQHYGDHSQTDIRIEGLDLNLISLLKLAPGGVYEKYQSYNSDGLVSLVTTIVGSTADGKIPVIESTFDVKNGKMTEPVTGISLEKLSIKGNLIYSDKKEILRLEELSGLFGKQPFSAQISISPLHTPDVKASFNGNINLSAIKQFFQLNGFEYLQGNSQVEGALSYSTAKDEVKISKGTIRVGEVAFKLKNEPMKYSDLSGELILEGKDAALRAIQGNIGSTQIVLNGIWRNFLPLVMRKSDKIILEAEVRSIAVDLDEILHRDNSKESVHQAFELPQNLYLNLKFSAGKLTYSTFRADNIYSRITLTPNLFKAENLQLDLASGHASGAISLEQQTKNLLALRANGQFEKINIARFFSLMDNFGQNYITHKNVEGITNGSLDVFVPMDSLLTPDKSKLISTCTFTINKGKLIQFTTLQETGDYLDKNKFVKPFVNTKELKKKLDVVEFETLSNTISIKNEVISVPEMEIKSNVMDLTVKGNHKFNDTIDYALNFRLRDVLVNKRDVREGEFGYIKDDGLGYRLFVRISGTTETPHITLDKEERQEKLKQDLQQEKQEFKAVLKQELGLFKKDSTLRYQEKPKEEVKFEVKWEEEPTQNKNPLPTDKQPKEKNPDKGLNKLLKKFGEPEPKEKAKVEIDIQD